MTIDKEAVKRANPIECTIPALLTVTPVKFSSTEIAVRCPFHDDTKPSLRLNAAKQTWFCDVCEVGGDVIAFVMKWQAVDFPTALAQLAERGSVMSEARSPKTIVATYDYCDEGRRLLYQAVRYAPKDFRQRRPDGHGGWLWNLPADVRRVPYRLPDLVGKPACVVVEGEKDADALWAINIPATTNVGGAGKWRAAYAGTLKAIGLLRVVVSPDQDERGQAHAATVARSCHEAGLTVRLLELPGLPPKGDVSDYLASHTRQDLLGLLTTLKDTPAYEPVPSPASPDAIGVLRLTALGDLLAEPDEVVEWVVTDRIPRASLCLLAGKPKAGKSTLARDLALQVATGGRCLGWTCSPGPVWYVAFEDKRSEVRKHFRRMGASGSDPVRFIFPQHIADLLGQLQTLATQERPTLIIVDTLQRLIGARDLNDYAEVTTKLTPLLTLARETGAAVLLVHHAGKGDRAGIDAVLGSTALAGSVDNILLFGRTERYRLLASHQRIGPDLLESIVRLDEATGRVSLGATRHAADVSELKAAMLGVLGDESDALGQTELEKQVEGRVKVKREALRQLVRDGDVVRVGAGRRGDPYRYAISPTLVPGSRWEQETEKPKTAKTPDKQGSDSCSQKTPEFGDLAIGQKSNGRPIDDGDGWVKV